MKTVLQVFLFSKQKVHTEHGNGKHTLAHTLAHTLTHGCRLSIRVYLVIEEFQL